MISCQCETFEGISGLWRAKRTPAASAKQSEAAARALKTESNGPFDSPLEAGVQPLPQDDRARKTF